MRIGKVHLSVVHLEPYRLKLEGPEQTMSTSHTPFFWRQRRKRVTYYTSITLVAEGILV